MRRHQLPCEPLHVSSQRWQAFLLRRSRRDRFRFVAGTEPADPLTVWKNGVLLTQATAVFAILAELGWPWIFLLPLRCLPLFIINRFFQAPSSRPNFPHELPLFSSRPDVFMTAQWRQLVIINYAVPASCLLPYLPAGVELDEWQGEILVSLVGFAFTGTSLLSMTLPFCSDFEEVNLRFYVKRREGEVWRRGVVFIKEIVPFSIIAASVNLLYGENYEACLMNHEAQPHSVSYSWSDARGSCALRAEFSGEKTALEPGTLAEFITEHYFGYAKRSPHETIEYEVEHPRWQVWNQVKGQVIGDFKAFYPTAITQHMTTIHSTVFAEGSPVRVMHGRNCIAPPSHV